MPEGGWISLEFPSVYDSGKYYKVTSVKENGTELKVTRMDGVEKENERGPFPDSYYFDTVNKDATYEITIEASYPEVKNFYYNLYVKRGDFDSYSNEGMITNLTDSKVQLLTTTKELDGGVLRDPFIILPFGYRDYEKQHSISYKYEYYRVKDGKDTRLDLTGNSVSVDLKDIFANIKDEKQVKVYAVVTKTRKEDGAFKTFKTEDVTITCKYEGGDFGIDIANADTIHQIQSNRIVVLMKKTNENNEAASCEIKREGDEDYTKIEKAGNGFPYVITQNGTYTIRLTDKFGSSIATYRRSHHKTYVKSVFHGAYRREVFEKAGLFNENLGRTEDNEMHYRILKAGYKICYNPKIISYQHTRNTWRGMIKQNYGNGYWIGLTVGICPRCFSIYHFVNCCQYFSFLHCWIHSPTNKSFI